MSNVSENGDCPEKKGEAGNRTQVWTAERRQQDTAGNSRYAGNLKVIRIKNREQGDKEAL